MKTRFLALASLVGLMAALLAGQAQAILYGDFVDPAGTVSFLNVADVNGLYGGPLDALGNPTGPTVSLNSLDFTPVNFDAQCSNCPGGQTTADTISFEIDAVSGQAISQIDITEAGSFTLNIAGFGTGFSFAQATITANISIDVFEVNGQSVNNVNGTSALSFGFEDATQSPVVPFIDLIEGVDPIPSEFLTGTFTGAGSIDLTSILVANGFAPTDQATRVLFTMDNRLTVLHDAPGGSAFIEKRDFDSTSITIVANPVPEPGTALLILGGLAALSGSRTRRND